MKRLMLNIKYKGRGTISFKLASQLAAEMSTNLLSQVYAQISPDIVGNEKRDLEVATEYGRRLEAISENTNSHTVDHLVKHYPAHDFIIDDDEARLWFNNVDFPSEELYKLLTLLGDDALAEANPARIFALTPNDNEDEDEELDDGPEEEAGASARVDGASTVDDRGAGNSTGDSSSAGARTPGPEAASRIGVQENAKVRPIRPNSRDAT